MASVDERLGYLYFLITDKDSDLVAERLRYASENDIRGIFEDAGCIWNFLVEHDVKALLSGDRPRYFMHFQDWEELYRRNHHIWYSPPEREAFNTMSWKESFDFYEKLLEETKKERIKWGTDLWMERYGYACRNEQRFFYDSQEWKDRAAAARCEWWYKCNHCGKRGKGMHAHHTNPIFTAYCNSFHRNFWVETIRVLCEKCHKKFHAERIRGEDSFEFQLATPEQVKAEKDYLRRWHEIHDEKRDCKFCNNFGYR